MATAIYTTKESFRNGKSVIKTYKRYSDLKKDLTKMCEENIDADGVGVYRSRRGEWGEWSEHWDLNDKGKPIIVKEGWM